jgi:hypothetical protein
MAECNVDSMLSQKNEVKYVGDHRSEHAHRVV